MLKDSPELMKTIDDNRQDMDLNKQEEIIKTLEEKRFDIFANDMVTNFKLYDKSIKELYNDLYKLGVVPTQKLTISKRVDSQCL